MSNTIRTERERSENMINRVVITGRLTGDPSLRYTPNGVPCSTFTLAVNRNFKSEGQPDADFIQCVVWRKPAENVANYLKKGSLAGVDGRIQTRSYDGQDGKKVYVTEVVADSVQFLDSRKSEGQQHNQQQQPKPDADPFSGNPIDDSDLPF